MAVPKCDTAIIAWNIGSFTSIALGATEGNDVSIDANEGDGESKISSSKTHDELVTACQLERRTENLKQILPVFIENLPGSGIFPIIGWEPFLIYNLPKFVPVQMGPTRLLILRCFDVFYYGKFPVHRSDPSVRQTVSILHPLTKTSRAPSSSSSWRVLGWW